MIKISVSAFGKINRLIVEQSRFWELKPCTSMLIMGKTGAGKTLLAWLLYLVPLYIASYVARLFDASTLSHRIEEFMMFMCSSCGVSRLCKDLLSRAVVEICRRGIEGGTSEASFQDRVDLCIVIERGEIRTPKLYADKDVLKRFAMIILRGLAPIASLPMQVRVLVYTIAGYISKFRKIFGYRGIPSSGFQSALINELARLAERNEEVAKAIASVLITRIPLFSLMESEERIFWSPVNDLAALLDIGEVVDLPQIEYGHVEYSYGELSARQRDVLIRLTGDITKQLRGEDPFLYPIILLDDAFDGLATWDAVMLSRKLVELSKRQSYTIIVTTHRPDVPIIAFVKAMKMEEETASPLDLSWHVYVASYNLAEVSRAAGVPRDFRLWLASIDRLDERAYNEVQREFFGVETPYVFTWVKEGAGFGAKR